MKKSNICFLIYDFSSTGGAERASAKLMNELSRDHNITVISVFNKYPDISYQVNGNIKIFKLFDGKDHILKNIGCIVKSIRKIMKDQKIDCLLAVDVATALMGVLGTRFTKIKLIVCDRSSCFNEDMYSMKNLRIYAWLGIHFSDYYQVMTIEGKKGCIEQYHVNQKKIIVIPNWLESNAIRNVGYHHENKRIISVGRATPEKNYEELINIAKRIKAECIGWQWHIWGNFDNSYGKELLNRIKCENLDDFLVYKGVTNSIFDVYQNYSLFVLTSRFEGMPNVLLEARGSQLPVIAYNCKTGPSELIDDGINGFLVPLDKRELMCERIISVVKDKELAERLAAHSHEGLKKFSKEDILKKWERILN